MEEGQVILVSGGAGYIGSHTVLTLREKNAGVLVLDDLSEGHEEALRGAELCKGSTLDRDFLAEVFAAHSIDAVCHFAAHCYVGESVTDPGKYYRNNVLGTLNLLEAMAAAGVDRFVFSSTCATYGEPDKVPICEDESQTPINPYGQTKLMCERIMRDFQVAHGLNSIALRYFNAAGADPEGRIGEDHDPETHLIPLVLQAVAGQREKVTIFGDDYDTPDGTCIRDYVHVTDLAAAHVLALDAIADGKIGFDAFNLGNEEGASVSEVIQMAAEVTGEDVPHDVGARRPGDPPILVGSSAKIRSELGWNPRFGDTRTIVETAWRWHGAHPNGFRA